MKEKKSNLRDILKSRFVIFTIGMIIFKIILMVAFSSDYQNKMFLPFVQKFFNAIVSGSNFNVYEYYYQNKLLSSFPYPPLMLYIVGITYIWISILHINSIFLMNFLAKLPILIFDILGMVLLFRLYPNKKKYIGILYFSSPIILYAGYMHGQLDIIPTTILTGALLCLCEGMKNKRVYLSAILLGMALGTKLHILAVVPFVVILVYHRFGWKTLLKYVAIMTLTFGVIVLPFLSVGFIHEVFLNTEQSLLTRIFLDYKYVRVYVPILCLAYLYITAINLNAMSREMLLYFCGITFSVFLAMIPPMPGWYIWIVPFITIYFILSNREKANSLLNYVILNAVFLVYFILFHQRGFVDLYLGRIDLSFLKINNDLLKNVTFTLLIGAVLNVAVLMFQNGLKRDAFYKRKKSPFIIGIAGDSGAGKSSYIRVLEDCLGKERIMFIEGDGDHRWERNNTHWEEFTQLNPKANYLYRQAEDIKLLKAGNTVERVDYDHSTGKFTEKKRVSPNRFVIACGLHALYLPQMRRYTDLKVYLDTDENLRRYWKIQRDTKSRGYSKEKVMKQILDRVPDAEKYIYPQKKYADLLVKYFDKDLCDYMVDDYVPSLNLEFVFSSEVNTEDLFQSLSDRGISVEYDYTDDLKQQIVRIYDGELAKISISDFENIVSESIPYVEDITESIIFDNDYHRNMIKLFTILLIGYKMKMV